MRVRAQLDAFAPRMVSVLLPMLMRLGDDTSEWEEAEPEDGLLDDDCEACPVRRSARRTRRRA